MSNQERVERNFYRHAHKMSEFLCEELRKELGINAVSRIDGEATYGDRYVYIISERRTHHIPIIRWPIHDDTEIARIEHNRSTLVWGVIITASDRRVSYEFAQRGVERMLRELNTPKQAIYHRKYLPERNDDPNIPEKRDLLVHPYWHELSQLHDALQGLALVEQTDEVRKETREIHKLLDHLVRQKSRMSTQVALEQAENTRQEILKLLSTEESQVRAVKTPNHPKT